MGKIYPIKPEGQQCPTCVERLGIERELRDLERERLEVERQKLQESKRQHTAATLRAMDHGASGTLGRLKDLWRRWRGTRRRSSELPR